MLTPPKEGDDCRQLWRKVVECVDVLNALQNMTGVIEGTVRMQGKLEVNGSSSKLTFTEEKEVSS